MYRVPQTYLLSTTSHHKAPPLSVAVSTLTQSKKPPSWNSSVFSFKPGPLSRLASSPSCTQVQSDWPVEVVIDATWRENKGGGENTQHWHVATFKHTTESVLFSVGELFQLFELCNSHILQTNRGQSFTSTQPTCSVISSTNWQLGKSLTRLPVKISVIFSSAPGSYFLILLFVG